MSNSIDPKIKPQTSHTVRAIFKHFANRPKQSEKKSVKRAQNIRPTIENKLRIEHYNSLTGAGTPSNQCSDSQFTVFKTHITFGRENPFCIHRQLEYLILLFPALELLKHLRGDDASFLRRRTGGMVIIYRGMVFSKMVNGGMVLFSGEMASPASPSTRVLIVGHHRFYQ